MFGGGFMGGVLTVDRRMNASKTDCVTDSWAELDRLFDLLSDRRRRYLFSYLRDRPDEVVAFDDLVSALAEREAHHDGYADDRTIAISLIHDHLPRFADAAIIEYDRAERTVRWAGAPIETVESR